MQASTTLRRSAISKRTAAYVIALLAVLALAIAAAFVANAINSSTAVPQGHSQGAPVCSSSMCDYKRYDQAPAAEAPTESWPSEGLVP
jgi:hypothetical protein